jgi:hypothetical protein
MAGIRQEPATSDPIPNKLAPDPSKDPSPPELPAGVLLKSQGLFVLPETVKFSYNLHQVFNTLSRHEKIKS